MAQAGLAGMEGLVKCNNEVSDLGSGAMSGSLLLKVMGIHSVFSHGE